MESKVLEYVRNQKAKLKDDLQHYTMVEKDSALASQIRYDLEQFETIEKKLKAFDIISKAYGDYANHKISEYELIMIVGENTTC